MSNALFQRLFGSNSFEMSQPNNKQSTRVLVAEDDAAMRHLLAAILQDNGYLVDQFEDGIHLVARVLSQEIDYCGLIISDVRMPGLTGLEFLEGIKAIRTHPPVILITAFGDEETHARSTELGAAVMLDKPFELDELLSYVRRLAPLQPPMAN